MLFNPVFGNWYTDTVDIYRTEDVEENNVTVQRRNKKNDKPVPCRIYVAKHSGPKMEKGAARVESVEKLSCGIDVKILAGDELMIVRGGNIGAGGEPERFFAGKPRAFHDPVGGVLTGLSHLEVAILTDDING